MKNTIQAKAWILITAILCCLLINTMTNTYDNAHFYRATFFSGEPRLDNDWLSTIDLSFGGGNTTHGISGHEKKECCNPTKGKTSFLNIYGLHNMHLLGAGVPCKDLSNPADVALQQLGLLAGRGDFGKLSFCGKFNTLEFDILYSQNFKHGIFWQLQLPIRQLAITNTCFTDLSPDDNGFPNKQTREWVTFLALFDTILSKHCLSKAPVKSTAVGDLSVLLGWTWNYEDTEELDYLDTTIKAGLLLPTGKKKNQNFIFDLPTGYDGHTAVALSAAASLGAFEWLTLGGYIDSLFFFARAKNIRMKTALEQSGLIKLARGGAKVQPGTLFNGGGYVKADHCWKGFSFLLGYSFSQQNDTIICPCNPAFNSTIASSDEMFKFWNMHTLHLNVEYDFTKEDMHCGCRVAFFYNPVLGGKRIFRTYMVGGTLGVDIGLSF